MTARCRCGQRAIVNLAGDDLCIKHGRAWLRGEEQAAREGPEPDATDWYGRPEPITDELKARADAEWLAMDAKGRLPE